MDLRPNGPDEGGCPLNFCNPVVGTRGKQPNKTSYSIAQQGRGMGSPRHLSTSPVLHHQIPPPNGTAAASERAARDSRGRPHPFADGSGEAATARPGLATSGLGSGVNAAEAVVGGGFRFAPCLSLAGFCQPIGLPVPEQYYYSGPNCSF